MEGLPDLLPGQISATNYGAFVLNVLPTMSRGSQGIEQPLLCQCLGMASSFLLKDTTIDAEKGLQLWEVGFNRLIDIVVALHSKGELDLESLNAASKACSECWTVAGSWRTLEPAKDCVRRVAGKLKRLLDENGRTYQGHRVYAP